MSTVVLDTITGKSTATTITIGSTPVVSASANSMTIRGEGTAQTSIQQGLAKCWVNANMSGTAGIYDSFNTASIVDNGTGNMTATIANDMANNDYSDVWGANTYHSVGNNSDKATGECTSTFHGTDNSAADCSQVKVTIHGDLA
tara:strand:+ start:191 stop:622 length:432 start_codon:yes stop_codon:yes gene_type:complete